MAYDNLCKYLAEQYPDQFAAWLLGQPLPAVEVLKTELSSEPIRADSVTLLHGAGLILHLEFQVEMKSKPPLPFRMLDYWVRLYRRYELPVKQVLVMLKQTEAEVPEEFRAAQTWHRYQVVRMWEQEPGPLLQAEALLPLAVLAQGESPARLLEQVAERVSKLASGAGRPAQRRAQPKNLTTGSIASVRGSPREAGTTFPLPAGTDRLHITHGPALRSRARPSRIGCFSLRRSEFYAMNYSPQPPLQSLKEPRESRAWSLNSNTLPGTASPNGAQGIALPRLKQSHSRWVLRRSPSAPAGRARPAPSIEPQERRRELSSCAQVLAGLRYEKGLIQRIFKEGVMKESVIYQEIVEEGRQEGLRQGIQQGIQQERGLILRLLNRRVGPLDAATQERLESLSISQLEALGEALLDFAVPADLTRWLDQQAPGAPPA